MCPLVLQRIRLAVSLSTIFISRKLSSKTTAANPNVWQQKLTPPHSIALSTVFATPRRNLIGGVVSVSQECPLAQLLLQSAPPISLVFDQIRSMSLQRRHTCNLVQHAYYCSFLCLPFCRVLPSFSFTLALLRSYLLPAAWLPLLVLLNLQRGLLCSVRPSYLQLGLLFDFS